jgi:hypothetical protein
MTLSVVLRIKRQLDGFEIDEIISDLQAAKRWRPNVGGVPNGIDASCPPAAFRRNKITLVTHRCHMLHISGGEIAREQER